MCRQLEMSHPRGLGMTYPLETIEQQDVVLWLRTRGIPHFAVPNGGWRNKVTAARLRREGVSAGVPDLVIPFPPKGAPTGPGVVIEMKRQGGRPSDVSAVQQAWLSRFEENSWKIKIAYGAKEAIVFLTECGYSA